MKIIQVQAAERFDGTEFSNEIIDGMTLPLTATYTCPCCDAQVSFHKCNFERALSQQHSNLRPALQSAFDGYASEQALTRHRFLDWVCPSCGVAARVYFQGWAGGRHGDGGVSLLVVLESEPEAHAA